MSEALVVALLERAADVAAVTLRRFLASARVEMQGLRDTAMASTSST